MTYTSELGCSLVIRTLVEEAKVSSLAIVWAPRTEMDSQAAGGRGYGVHCFLRCELVDFIDRAHGGSVALVQCGLGVADA